MTDHDPSAMSMRTPPEAPVVTDRPAEAEEAAPASIVDRSDEPLLDDRMASLIADMGRAFRDLTGRVVGLGDRLEDLPARLADALGAMRDAVADLAETQGQLDKRVAQTEQRVAELATAAEAQPDVEAAVTGAVSDRLDAMAEEQSGNAAALGEALGRARQVAEAIESLDQRRGFRKLKEAEREWGERQKALSVALTDAAERLGERVESLETELGTLLARVDASRISDEIGSRLSEGVEALQASIAEQLGERVAAGLRGVTDASAEAVAATVGAAVRDVRAGLSEDVERLAAETTERATAAVRDEISDIRKKIDSWGRLRSSPKLAEEIGSVEARVEQVERAVEGDLVDMVFQRMQRAFDRSFEALVQLVDARMREAATQGRPGEHERRGRFRRGRDEE